MDGLCNVRRITFKYIYNLEPYFQNKTSYTSAGEVVGSVQIANVILDGFRKSIAFLSAGTIPINTLLNNSPPLAHWLIKLSFAKKVMSYIPSNGGQRGALRRFHLGNYKAKPVQYLGTKLFVKMNIILKERIMIWIQKSTMQLSYKSV